MKNRCPYQSDGKYCCYKRQARAGRKRKAHCGFPNERLCDLYIKSKSKLKDSLERLKSLKTK